MTDDNSAKRIKEWQDSLFAAFRHNDVLGDRYLGPVLEMEPVAGDVFVRKYYGHRVLTDSFLDFFGETLTKQALYNAERGWPKDQPYYSTCLVMYQTMFRSLRSAEILSLNGYPLQGYIIQRSLKDQAFVLWGAASNFATFGELFGWQGMEDGKWGPKQQQQIVKNRMSIENKLTRNIIGDESGLPSSTKNELENWNRLFNIEAHRGLFTTFRTSHQILTGQQPFAPGPINDEGPESMYMNRCTEICWMMLRLLPFMRRADTPKDVEWIQKWALLDKSFKMMVDGLAGLGKKIAPAMVEMINAKFIFDTSTHFFEPNGAWASGVKCVVKPVTVGDTVQCYDIRLDGIWHGSKRTKQQCDSYISWVTRHKQRTVAEG